MNYIEHVLILASAVIASVSIFVFASLAGIPLGITSSIAKFANRCQKKNYKSISKNKKKKHENSILSKNQIK